MHTAGTRNTYHSTVHVQRGFKNFRFHDGAGQGITKYVITTARTPNDNSVTQRSSTIGLTGNRLIRLLLSRQMIPISAYTNAEQNICLRDSWTG